MIRTSFSDGWTVGPKQSLFAAVAAPATRKEVVLPHDALRELARSEQSPNGSHTGYYPSAHVVYEKVFEAPDEWAGRTVVVEFEGVYRDATVSLNGDTLVHQSNGYSPFSVELGPFLRIGASNVIRVEARSHQDSRWYAGVGINRNVWLGVSDAVSIAFDAMVITTPQVDREFATVDVSVDVRNDGRQVRSLRLRSRILGADGTVVAERTTPVTVAPNEPAPVHLTHYVRSPRLWDLHDPHLYHAEVTVHDGSDQPIDLAESTFGIRTIQVDPFHGFRLNGRSVKLRGGCVHHDNGILGAASIDRAEQRKAEILKAAGYNAVRSAHNPASPAFLDACDRVGLLVMDELTDVWTTGKTSYDASLTFPESWERDVEALIRNGRNHPSVIMYSIGNEILETGRPGGALWGRRIAEKVRTLDPTRPITNAVNGLVSILDARVSAHDDSILFDFNAVLSGDGSGSIGASEIVTQRTEEAHAQVDVAGINYSEARYDLDAERFPDRIIVGTESFPGRLDHLWRLVKKHPQVIGDFAWTAWDHLGEAGTGRAVYDDDPVRPVGMASPYPWLLSHAGTIDVNGLRRPISYWRETVWGLRTAPYIAVHRPQRHGRPLTVGRWAWDDVVGSWAWSVDDGAPVVVDVYADADEVELLLDGATIGTAPVGIIVADQERAAIARFETEYRKGTLTAVSRRDGREIGRSELRSLDGEVTLQAAVERDRVGAGPGDLAYVHLLLADKAGTIAVDRETAVEVEVLGPGELMGMSGAKPDDEESFTATSHRTHEGRLLAIVRPTGAGEIRVTATSSFGMVTALVFATDQDR
jgi:beta-galactosidase